MRQRQKVFSAAHVEPFVEPAETSTGEEANKDVSDIIYFGNQPDTNVNLDTDEEKRIKE